MLLLFPCALITVKSNFIQTSTAYSCSTHIASHAELALQVLLGRILQSDCSEYKHLQCGNYPCSCSASFMVVHESGDFGLLFGSENRPLIHVNADQENRPCDSQKTIASKFLGYFFTDENRGGDSLVFFSDQESPLILKREGKKHQNGAFVPTLYLGCAK